jgi:hypothetical protein
MLSSGMLSPVAFVRIDVSEKLSASIIRVTRIGELGTTLAVTSKTHGTKTFLRSVRRCVIGLEEWPCKLFVKLKAAWAACTQRRAR